MMTMHLVAEEMTGGLLPHAGAADPQSTADIAAVAESAEAGKGL